MSHQTSVVIPHPSYDSPSDQIPIMNFSPRKSERRHSARNYKNILDYAINEQKTVSKKQSACNRPPVTFKESSDGQIENQDGLEATINLYRTNSSCLINGSPHIVHPILESLVSLLDGDSISDLDKQIQIELSKFNTKYDKTRKSSVNNSPIECLKCHRPARTKAVECETCQQWIHYNCDRLSKQEILAIENGSTYSCKKCIVHQVSLPTPDQSQPMIRDAVSHPVAILPVISKSGPTPPSTVTHTIMVERSNLTTASSSTPPDSSEPDTCDSQNSIAHTILNEQADLECNNPIVYSTSDIAKTTSAGISSLPSNIVSVSSCSALPKGRDNAWSLKTKNTCPNTTPLEVVGSTLNKSSTQTTSSQEAIHSENSRPQHSQPDATVKLKQWERKLSKREDALKSREQASSQNEKDIAHARSYMLKLEEQVKELDSSNRRLHRELLTTDTTPTTSLKDTRTNNHSQQNDVSLLSSLVTLLQPILSKSLQDQSSAKSSNCSCDNLKERVANLEYDLRYLTASWEGYHHAQKEYRYHTQREYEYSHSHKYDSE